MQKENNKLEFFCGCLPQIIDIRKNKLIYAIWCSLEYKQGNIMSMKKDVKDLYFKFKI